MTTMARLLQDEVIPTFHRVQCFENQEKLDDMTLSVKQQLSRPGTLERVPAGARVAIAVGSRRIDQLPRILKTLIRELKNKGAIPFIIPAMGNHGGATAEGQANLLRSMGVSDKSMNVPILSGLETVMVGRTHGGMAVHVDRYAVEADMIIPVNRIKPNGTEQANLESGLVKMLAVGLGNQSNATRLHQMAQQDFSQNMLQMARVILEQCMVPFGLGVIENANHQIWQIAAIPAEHIEAEEPQLLQQARLLMPCLPYPKIDILMIDVMGSDISSTGIDPTIAGRSITRQLSKPFPDRIGVLNLSRRSAGDAYGIGLADCVTHRLFSAMDRNLTFQHAVMTNQVECVRIPPIMESDEQCLRFLMKTCPGSGATGFRIIWLKNTWDLSEFHVSEGLMLDSLNRPEISVDQKTLKPAFDDKGRFLSFI